MYSFIYIYYLFTKKFQAKAKFLIQTYNYNTVYVTGKTWVKRLKS